MNLEMTYEHAIKNADALKALGQTQVHLYGRKVEPPWHIATECEAGSAYRLGLSTSVKFTGEQDGLTFSWFFDLEPRDANGTSATRVNVDGVKQVLGKLKGPALVQFRTYLSDCAAAVKKQGDEYQAIADRQFCDAAVLRDLVNHRCDGDKHS